MQDTEVALQEQQYFDMVMAEIERQLREQVAAYEHAEQELQVYLNSSWEDGTHMGASIDRLIEAVQIGKFARTQELLADKRMERIRALRKLSDSAYFARVDFSENEEPEEKIYIGRHSLYDADRSLLVYDWRAPISSIFYRFEKGPVSYEAPQGQVRGEVSLKRQYEIRKGVLKYFFDADVEISDEFLRRMLSQNTSAHMKTIVETIQKEQDVIIRDSSNDLLIVQGGAGSGKTSIALHRIAYLMYEGLQKHLNASDILIISPNTVFESYISTVLPELGEQNIQTLEFERIAAEVIGEPGLQIQSKNDYLETLLSVPSGERRRLAMDMAFKTSGGFASMIRKYRDDCLRHMTFFDLYVGEEKVAKKEELHELLTRAQDRASVEGRLERLRGNLAERLRVAQPQRHQELMRQEAGRHEDSEEDEIYARMTALREARRNHGLITEMTRLDYRARYRRLITDPALLNRLYGNGEVPHVEEMCAYSAEHADDERMSYADAMAFAWMLLQFRRNESYRGIKQVVVDEAQDYAPLQYEILAKLFPYARYTVLGDVNQSIGKTEDERIYDRIEHILKKRMNLRMTLRKSFRCTNQIISYASRFIEDHYGLESFNRDGGEVRVTGYKSEDALLKELPLLIGKMHEEGCESIAVIAKTGVGAAAAYSAYGLDAQLILKDREYDLTGVMFMPIYLAKGLEFDGVIVLDADAETYRSKMDRRLLYVACTRALHVLHLVYSGSPSAFLKEGERNV